MSEDGEDEEEEEEGEGEGEGEGEEEEKDEEDKPEEEEMDLDTMRKMRRFSAMSIEGHSSDDAESQSPPRMPSLQPLQPSILESPESQIEAEMSERSRPQGLGIHSSGRRIAKSRSRSRSPKKGMLKYESFR